MLQAKTLGNHKEQLEVLHGKLELIAEHNQPDASSALLLKRMAVSTRVARLRVERARETVAWCQSRRGAWSAARMSGAN